MIDDGVITGNVLLQHMQGMKGELKTEMVEMRKDLQAQIDTLGKRIDTGFTLMREGFEDARKHREALQEDLNETIRVQGLHGRKLTRLSSARAA